MMVNKLNQYRYMSIALFLILPFVVQAQPAPLYLDPAQPVEARVKDLISRLTLEEKAMLLNHRGPDIERFGIQSDKWNQCLHGVWWDRPTTMFPISIAMAATWDPKLIHEVATAISDEARAIYNGWHQRPGLQGREEGPDLPRPGDQHRPQSLLGPHQRMLTARTRS